MRHTCILISLFLTACEQAPSRFHTQGASQDASEGSDETPGQGNSNVKDPESSERMDPGTNESSGTDQSAILNSKAEAEANPLTRDKETDGKMPESTTAKKAESNSLPNMENARNGLRSGKRGNSLSCKKVVDSMLDCSVSDKDGKPVTLKNPSESTFLFVSFEDRDNPIELSFQPSEEGGSQHFLVDWKEQQRGAVVLQSAGEESVIQPFLTDKLR